MDKYTIALIQMDCVFADKAANMEKAERLVREAAGNGAALVCLPEVFNGGYLGTDIPVSYTHLDVYKRQPVRQAAGTAEAAG